MVRTLFSVCVLVAAAGVARGSEISGVYLETRTCQVYTGPCFANAEMGLAGKEAIMAWNIRSGERDGVDLSGLSVLVVFNASETLGHHGIDDAQHLKSIILVDDRATEAQHNALVSFARQHAGRAGEAAVRVDPSPIKMSLDTVELNGHLEAGKSVKLSTRKARPGDCICRNEIAFYPPLAKVNHFAPGVAIESEFSGKGLGNRWSTPGSRSVYMGTFAY